MASHTLFSLLLLLLLLSFHLISPIHCSEEEFTEELLLKPLPDRKVAAHFHFRTVAPPSPHNGKHHHLFPKSISQLVKKHHIRELELSFTQGRWNYAKWGGSDPLSTANAKPPGVELWALFDLSSKPEIDATWRNLTHSLSGLFCASINFLEASTSHSTPLWAFIKNTGEIKYGALPREAVCTENLTPWLKLLPCRDKSGIAFLLDRPSIYKAHFHSQRLRLKIDNSNGIIVDQTLTVVLQPSDYSTWFMSQLFKKKLMGKCALAKSSKVFLEIEGDSGGKTENMFELFGYPDREIKDENGNSILYEYNVERYNEDEPLDLGIKWKKPLKLHLMQAPFHVNRFLIGSGNERGSIAISFHSTKNSTYNNNINDKCEIKAAVFQVVPWYVKVYYHTLKIYINGKIMDFKDIVEKINVVPSEDKVLPGTLEMMLRFPCGTKSATLTLDFDKGFLHIDEYPPDANQGFDIPSAVITFPDVYLDRIYQELDSRILQLYKERKSVRAYTEVLLVPLTTPDFSMPYNVITFTCTVLALYFGSMVNVLRRRIGEEERLAKNKDGAKRGLITMLISKIKGRKEESTDQSESSKPLIGPKLIFKVVLIAGLAVVWHYFVNNS
ncbi:hypothetical protein LUZ60_007979 [Juncus effusus]|nr:hypothetical protein LUZ60_007979 [Juncus effusus]